MAVDVKSGRAAAPKTLNRYGYCWNNPSRMVDLDGKEPEVPSLELVFPEGPPLEESIKPSISEQLTTLKSSEPLEEKTYIEDILGIEVDLEKKEQIEEDYGDGITAGLRELTSDWNGVLLISSTTSYGAGGYMTEGWQLAMDWHGNCVLYRVYGTGVEAGESAKGSVGVGIMNLDSAEKAGGYGVEIGGSVGEGPVIGGSALFTEDQYGNLVLSGGMVNCGFGLNTIVEGHVGMSYAVPVAKWNNYDAIDSFWIFLQNIFSVNTSLEQNKD